jgi:creatine kinase
MNKYTMISSASSSFRSFVVNPVKQPTMTEASTKVGIAVAIAAASSALLVLNGMFQKDDGRHIDGDIDNTVITSKRDRPQLLKTELAVLPIKERLFLEYRKRRQLLRTYCDEEPPPHTESEPRKMKESDKFVEHSFPNLSRHGERSMLRKILTESMYNELRTRTTSRGVTIEDLIRAGVCLPYGANPPHGVAGVYAGDAESYTTFAPLLDPIIETHHKATTRVRLQRFRTNLNPGGLIQHRLDPTGEYILYTRMRLARSIVGFRFTPCMTRSERRAVERLVRDCVSDWNLESKKSGIDDSSASSSGGYVSVMDMTNKQHDDLVRRQLLFTEPDDYTVSAGLARDWPDGRGIYCDTWVGTPNLMIWCNAADHVWIISNSKGGDVQGVFKRMSKAVWALETALKQREHGFVEDRRLGFLNASPADIGTALRASVYIKLVRLGQHKGFHSLMKRLHLEARPEQYAQTTADTKRYTGIFDIGNAEALGKTEVQLINIMIHGVAVCIDLERRLQNGETLDLDAIIIGKIPASVVSTPPSFP